MSPQTLSALHRLTGHHIALQLSDGTRMDDCELVSAGHRRSTVWLISDGADCFLPLADITEVWQTS